MMIPHTNRLLSSIAGIVALLAAAGCATAPVQEMSDARQAIAAARDADAARRTPELLHSAEQSLQDAQLQLKNYFYTEARKRAIAAKAQAVQARREAEEQERLEQEHAAQAAIAVAQRAIQESAALGGSWRDSDSVLKSAEAALQASNYAQAWKRAELAGQQAQQASNQAYLEKARHLITVAKSRRHPSKMQRRIVKAAEAALHQQAGKQAYMLIKHLCR